MAYLQGKLMCSHISIHKSKPQNKGGGGGEKNEKKGVSKGGGCN